MRDSTDIERCAHTCHDATADQAGPVERYLLGDWSGLLVGHDTIFGKRAQEHQLLKLAAIGQHATAFAVERARVRSLPKILLAKDRGIAVAVEAMPAMRIP